ncbi:hypothetical protein JOC27_000484 [Sporolactobacillus spathodeae]|uniref:Uncharacterized protein n=1 Tax=Sporolactobacillus spathodeae TaxID=1465502 RepID=A0ABS2Q5P6_9BACL|nr:hypothetical protein [Sporolactobacillus spathodeae]
MNVLKPHNSANENYFSNLSIDKNYFNDYIKNSFISDFKVKMDFTLTVRDGDEQRLMPLKKRLTISSL